MDNASNCSPLDELTSLWAFEINLPVSCVSVLLCLATVALVCKQKLHMTLVYRLAMYQVLSAMEFSIIWIIASTCIHTFSPMSNNATDEVSMTPVIVLYSLLMGSSFIKLMFTVWISIHLFALAVFHKNLQRLERLYVVSSLLVPLAVTIVLLTVNLTHCHGNSTYQMEEIIFIIIYGVLVYVTSLMGVMGIILCH